MPYAKFSLATNSPPINRSDFAYQLIALIASANTHPLLAGHYRLILSDNRVIELATLNQQLTYLAFLFGNPTRSMNRDLMRSHVQIAEERQCRLSLRLKSVLMQPAVTPIQVHAHPRDLEEGILNPYEALPPILSVAVFDSTAVGAIEACSSALVVWYQDEWGLPTRPVIEALGKLDWTEYACDWTW